MSNTATFALGAGSGLALWYFTKPKTAEPETTKPITPVASPTSAPTDAAGSSLPPAPRNCVVHVDAVGLFVDGARATLDDAIRCCQATGRASVTLAKNAPASTCVALANALAAANVPTVRNAGNADISSTFTLVEFPDGIWGKKRVRYFRAEPPITWTEAHAHLLAAGVIDRTGRARWELYSSPERFRADQAAPLPTIARNADVYTKFTLRYYPEGRASAAKQRWFLAEAPMSWADARDRLIEAGVVDPSVGGRTFEPGGWMLSVDRSQFQAKLAEPLPGAARNGAETSATFTLAIYPEGQWGQTKRVRWFRAEPPTTWEDACDRLAAAGVIDPRVTKMGPSYPGAWTLTTEARVFDDNRASPLPPMPSRPRNAMVGGRPHKAQVRYTTDGRRIVRDGEPIVLVERVDLGSETYALSPAHTDQLVKRIAYLLDRYGMR